MNKNYTLADGINFSLDKQMKKNKKTLFFGLGADDPKRIFGTSKNLLEKYGSDRVFDFPTSENAMTGFGIGLALEGYRVIMVHQRMDFFLLAMDQLVNSAAKWHYMFDGKNSINITIRLIVGKGWGQGPTHSQNLQSWFAHIPGLKVVVPTFPNDAYQLLNYSINDPNPVLYIENRWLHNQKGKINLNSNSKKIIFSEKISKGKDITIVSSSLLTIQAIKANQILNKFGLSCDIININSIQPLKLDKVINSLKKTKNLLVLDGSSEQFGLSSEIISRISESNEIRLNNPPIRMAMPHFPVPTSHAISKYFYPSTYEIIFNVLKIFNKDKKYKNELKKIKVDTSEKDVPGSWFQGPF